MHEAAPVAGQDLAPSFAFLDGLKRRGRAPALIAVRHGTLETLCFEDLADRARGTASGLLGSGLSAGDAVALCGPNGFDWVIARLALDAAGMVAVPVDEFATDAELQTILRQCKARCAICPAARAETLRKSDPALRVIAFGEGTHPEGVERIGSLCASPVPALADIPAGRTAMLAYTSGTTGAPKAIVLTHANIETNVRALVESRLAGPGDRVLLPLPLHHIYPYVVGLLAALGSGATVVFPASTTGPELLEAIRLAEVTTIVGVPRLYSAICSGLMAQIRSAGWLRRALFRLLLAISFRSRRMFGVNPGQLLFGSVRARFGAKLQLLISGGARLEDDTLDMLLGLGFEVRSGYGLAETSSSFTANLPGRDRWGSEGKPIIGAVRISSPDRSGIGEIELKGPQIFSHYLDHPVETKAAFTEDDWFRTGDLGCLDRDGFLHVAGRARDTLVLGGGKKVNPEDLEKIYGASRYIQEIAIFERSGALAAIVVPALEAIRTGGALHLDTAIRVDLASRARELPSYQRLAGFAITREPLPRTRLGKYRRFLLPQIYERAKQPSVAKPSTVSAEDEALLANPIARQVYDLLRQRYPGAPLGLDSSPLLDLGIDSLEWISFGLELEDRLKLRLTEADISSVATIRDLLVVSMRAATAPAPTASEASSVDWIAPNGIASRILGAAAYILVWIAMWTLFRLRVEGRENIPAEGPFVVIANHTSYLDAPAIGAALSYRFLRRCYWAGDPAQLFARRWQRTLMRALHGYPVDERRPTEALAASTALLTRGDSIVWFPEGWRSPDGSLQAFLPGIGHLLVRRPAIVLPMHVAGAFEALPRGRTIPTLRPIAVRIGKPVRPSAWCDLDAGDRQTPQRVADLLHQAVEALAP